MRGTTRWAHAEVVDAPVLADAVAEHADHEEQPADDQPVGHHVEDLALHPVEGDGEGAQHDEAHVRDGRVGHQPLEVPLTHRDQGGVDDADHREGEHHRLGQRAPSGVSGSAAG